MKYQRQSVKQESKYKPATLAKVYESNLLVEEVAVNIARHYQVAWQGTGLKGQLLVPQIDIAVKYQLYWEGQQDESLKINSFILLDARKGKETENFWKQASKESQVYWNSLIKKYGSPEKYRKYVLDKFNDAGREAELIICLGDEPVTDNVQNVVLYLAYPFTGQELLHAATRVNQSAPEKEFGFVIDYAGTLDVSASRLTENNVLIDFREDDVIGFVKHPPEVLKNIPLMLDELWGIFANVKDNRNLDVLERFLRTEKIRFAFYKRLVEYGRMLQSVASLDTFRTTFSGKQRKIFADDLAFFETLRVSVQQRYAEAAKDNDPYQVRMQKFFTSNDNTSKVNYTIQEIDILDGVTLNETLLEYGKSTGAKADMIAHKIRQVCTEQVGAYEDPTLKEILKRIESVIDDFQHDRLTEQQYLSSVLDIRSTLEVAHQHGAPDVLKENVEAQAFFVILSNVLRGKFINPEALHVESSLAQASQKITTIVNSLAIRDWKTNADVQRKIENALEDFLLEYRKEAGIEFTFDELDEILAKVVSVAKSI